MTVFIFKCDFDYLQILRYPILDLRLLAATIVGSDVIHMILLEPPRQLKDDTKSGGTLTRQMACVIPSEKDSHY